MHLAVRFRGAGKSCTELIEGPNLHGPDALCQQMLCEFAGATFSPQVIVRILSVADAGVVDGYALAIAASQQVVNGLSGVLAQQVPQSDINGGDGAHFRAGEAAEIDQRKKVVPVVLDIDGIAPDQEGREEIVYDCADCARQIVSFAEANQAIIGVDADP